MYRIYQVHYFKDKKKFNVALSGFVDTVHAIEVIRRYIRMRYKADKVYINYSLLKKETA